MRLPGGLAAWVPQCLHARGAEQHSSRRKQHRRAPGPQGREPSPRQPRRLWLSLRRSLVVKVEQLGRAQQQRHAGVQQLGLVVHQHVDKAAVALGKPHEGRLRG